MDYDEILRDALHAYAKNPIVVLPFIVLVLTSLILSLSQHVIAPIAIGLTNWLITLIATALVMQLSITMEKGAPANIQLAWKKLSPRFPSFLGAEVLRYAMIAILAVVLLISAIVVITFFAFIYSIGSAAPFSLQPAVAIAPLLSASLAVLLAFLFSFSIEEVVIGRKTALDAVRSSSRLVMQRPLTIAVFFLLLAALAAVVFVLGIVLAIPFAFFSQRLVAAFLSVIVVLAAPLFVILKAFFYIRLRKRLA